MDYLDFYGFKEYPFSNVVDNRFYYDSDQHKSALLKLKYTVDTKKGLAVVVGDIGTGKTTLARKLLEELDEKLYEAALLVVVHSSVSSDWLLKKLAVQLGVKNVSSDKLNIISQIYQRLEEIDSTDKKAVVLIDEVQMLRSKELMEEFRGLLNIESSEGKLVNFIFFGLNELEDLLSLDKPLSQRVALKISLKPFCEDDAQKYILHRLRVAGGNDDTFTRDALKSIYHFSKGIPRLINTLCDNALLEGFLSKKNIINGTTIEMVSVDLGLQIK